MAKNYTEVLIDERKYTVGSDEDAEYVQQLSNYVNDKLKELRAQKSFQKQPYATKQTLILLNLADDYLKMKKLAEESRKRLEQQEAEFYNMKREMVDMQLQLEETARKRTQK